MDHRPIYPTNEKPTFGPVGKADFFRHAIKTILGGLLYAVVVSLVLVALRSLASQQGVLVVCLAHVLGCLPFILMLWSAERVLSHPMDPVHRFRSILRSILSLVAGILVLYIFIAILDLTPVLSLALVLLGMIGGNLVLTLMSYELMLYLIFGVLTTVVSIGSFTICEMLMVALIGAAAGKGFAWLIPQTVSFVLAVLFGFFTNRRWVFFSKGPIWQELVAFAGSRIVTSLILEYGGLFILVNVFGMASVPAKIVGSFLVVIANYFISKFWIFNREKPGDGEEARVGQVSARDDQGTDELRGLVIAREDQGADGMGGRTDE